MLGSLNSVKLKLIIRAPLQCLVFFAAGDATTEPFKQIIIAMGSGATASLGAFDYLIRHSEQSQEQAA